MYECDIDGHSYILRNRLTDNTQRIDFLRIENGQTIDGVFSQDVIEVVLNRMLYQVANDTNDPKGYRNTAAMYLQGFLDTMEDFTEWREHEGQKMIGHNDRDFNQESE